MKRTRHRRRNSQKMSKEKQFVVCTRNDEYEGALELRKIYETRADADAVPHDFIRVVDESGEDYLYPRSWFLPIELPRKIEEEIVEFTHR